MYARISFHSYQRITKQELSKLNETLADDVSHNVLVKTKDKDIETFWSHKHSLDPKDQDVIDGKKELVTESEIVELKTDKEYIADLDLFLVKHPQIKINIRGLPQAVDGTNSYQTIVQQMISVYEKFETALKQFDQSVEFNQKCDVHVSNLGLLHINQTGYAVDYCTEQLQELLVNGWRIIACCVQPDGRRPDYILGRYNPDETNLSCVKF
jgi:hypothetical protein